MTSNVAPTEQLRED